MTAWSPVRGEIYTINLIGEEKNYVVISSSARNRQLGTALVLRITSTVKPPMPSIVVIPHGECQYGRVLCDDIEIAYYEDVVAKVGGFTPNTMALIGDGLKFALSLN